MLSKDIRNDCKEPKSNGSTKSIEVQILWKLNIAEMRKNLKENEKRGLRQNA